MKKTLVSEEITYGSSENAKFFAFVGCSFFAEHSVKNSCFFLCCCWCRCSWRLEDATRGKLLTTINACLIQRINVSCYFYQFSLSLSFYLLVFSSFSLSLFLLWLLFPLCCCYFYVNLSSSMIFWPLEQSVSGEGKNSNHESCNSFNHMNMNRLNWFISMDWHTWMDQYDHVNFNPDEWYLPLMQSEFISIRFVCSFCQFLYEARHMYKVEFCRYVSFKVNNLRIDFVEWILSFLSSNKHKAENALRLLFSLRVYECKHLEVEWIRFVYTLSLCRSTSLQCASTDVWCSSCVESLT